MTPQEAVDAFWDAVPDGTTWIDLAEGMEIVLPGGKIVRTGTAPGYRTRSMMDYKLSLERSAVMALCSKD